MATTHRKTAKGVAEIETRAHRLPPRLRGALILVDGKRNDDELRTLVQQQADETLATLVEQGFIEVMPEAAPAPARARAAEAAPAHVPGPDITALRREAVHILLDLVGPMGEGLAMRIERAATAAELRGLVEQAQELITNTRGRDKAAAYAARFSGL